MFIPQCILICKDDQLELTDHVEAQEFTFENKWTSGPIKNTNLSSPEAFHIQLISILTIEITRQKKACLGVEWLIFDHEEQTVSRDLAKQIIGDCVQFDRETHQVSVTYGVNEVEVGMWLIEIINSKLC